MYTGLMNECSTSVGQLINSRSQCISGKARRCEKMNMNSFLLTVILIFTQHALRRQNDLFYVFKFFLLLSFFSGQESLSLAAFKIAIEEVWRPVYFYQDGSCIIMHF